MPNQKNKEKNSLMVIITIILVLNTVSILGIYLTFDKRIDNLGTIIIQLAQNDSRNKIEDEREFIDLPNSEYETLGNSDAPIQLQIVTDIECPHCQKLNTMLFPALEDTYIKMGLVNLSYHALPLENIHPKAMPIAKALYCANLKQNFWQSYKYFTENVNKLEIKDIITYSCEVDYDIELKIQEDAKKLKEAGITGTPAVIINGYKLNNISGYSDIKSEIDSILKSKTTDINLADVVKLVEKEGYQLLDVRSSKEFSNGSIDGAINIDVLQYNKFIDEITKIDKTKGYIVFCKSGLRSSWAWNILKNNGFSKVLNLKRGFDGWVEERNSK